MAMTPLPAAPQRDQDPATFATTADTFVAALPGFVTEANLLEANVDMLANEAMIDADTATTQAGIATTQAANALASANAADISEANALASANAAALSESNAATSEANAASSATSLTATSTTSNTIGTGSKVFTVQTGKQFVSGQYVQAISGSNWMFGTVTSYVTDQLTINVTDTNGSGTFASWAIAVSGIKGIQGPAGISSIGYYARTSNTQLVSADSAYLIDITSGTFSQTFAAAASLGAGWHVYIRNSGTGDITLDPNGAETIDGLTSFVMYPSEVRLIQCDGSALRSIVINTFTKTITASDNFIKPPGYSFFDGLAWGAGASGGKATTETAGGGGGACVPFHLRASDVASSTAVTIGAGGTPVTTANTQGNAGGNTTFGSLVTAYGGGPSGPSSATQYGGSGGGALSAGATGSSPGTQGGDPAGGHGATGDSGSSYGGGVGGEATAGKSFYGGGGGSKQATLPNAGSSYYGGAGGGGRNASTTGPGGTSIVGGNGGTGADTTNGGDGVAPGGGGGGTRTGTQSGAGARGEVRIWGVV